MAKRVLAALAIVLIITSGGAFLSPGAAPGQYVATLQNFADGAPNASVFYSDAGDDTSVSIKLPQRITLRNAELHIGGQALVWNDTFNATDRDDFLKFNLSRVDINSSAGNASLDKPYDDDFNDRSLDPRWMWRNPAANDEGNLTPGMLTLTSPAYSNFWGGQNNGSLLYQNISGYSWTLRVRVNGTPTLSGQRAGLLVFNNTNNWVEFSYGRINSTANGLRRVNTSNTVSLSVTTPVSGPVWLSLNRNGGLFTFSYSTDGVAYTRVNSMNMSWGNWWSNPVMVGLAIMDNNTGTPYSAVFDDFWTSRYSTAGFLTSPMSEYKDDVQSAQLHWYPVLPQYNTISVSARVFSGDSDWKYPTNHAKYDFLPPGNHFQYNVSFNGPGDSTLVLPDISGNLTLKSVPTNVAMDIGNKGTADWETHSTLGAPIKVNITTALLAAVKAATPDGNGDVTIPIRLHSDRRGTVTLANLTVEYIVNSAPLEPVQQSPDNATWSSTATPTLTFNATDPDGGVIWYQLQTFYNGSGSVLQTIDQRTSGSGWSSREYNSSELASYTFPYGGELQQGKRYQWWIRAYDGWAFGPWSPKRELYVDTTPPEGWVIDDGTETTSPDTLHANLSITDGDSEVVMYQAWLGTSPGSWDVVPPTNATEPAVTFTNLTLIYGNKYYFTARALNAAGLWSAEIKSDGIGIKKGSVNHEPSVTLSYPADGADLTGVVKVRGNATDIDFLDSLITSMQIDNGEWLDAEGNRSWSLNWDSSRVENGPHRLTVRAFDRTAHSKAVSINITVQNEHEIVIVDAQPSSEPKVRENVSVTFSITARDPFNRTLNYQWLVDGKPVSGETSASFLYRADYSSAGVHNVSVNVYLQPLETRYSWNVTVQNDNRPPVPVIATPPMGAELETGKSVRFDGTGSADPDIGEGLNYSWDFGDGNQASGLITTHIYKTAGTFTVILTVSDPYTYTTAAVEVTVKAGQSVAPSFLDQYGPYLLMALLVVVVLGMVVAFASWRNKKAEEEEEARRAGKRVPAAAKGAMAKEAEERPAYRTGMPTGAAGRRRPAAAAEPLYEEPAKEAPEYAAEAAEEEAPVAPAYEAEPAAAPESARAPAWAEETLYGGGAGGPVEETVPEAPAEPLEAPVAPQEEPQDEMSRILAMLATQEAFTAGPPEAPAEEPAPSAQEEAAAAPEEAPVAETAPYGGEEAAPAAEPGGLDDIFAKLANLSEEMERPAAPPPRPAAPAPAGPPARRGEVRPPAAQVVAPRPAVSPTLPTRPGAPKAAAAPAAAALGPGVKKRLLRCPKCQVIFEVQDTGVRPLPIKCTACGTTGSLKK